MSLPRYNVKLDGPTATRVLDVAVIRDLLRCAAKQIIVFEFSNVAQTMEIERGLLPSHIASFRLATGYTKNRTTPKSQRIIILIQFMDFVDIVPLWVKSLLVSPFYTGYQVYTTVEAGPDDCIDLNGAFHTRAFGRTKQILAASEWILILNKIWPIWSKYNSSG